MAGGWRRYHPRGARHARRSIVPENSGIIQFNTLKIEDSFWSGNYFPNIPANAVAIPNEGFIFSHWEEYPDSGSTIELSSVPENLTAVFVESNLTPGEIVINEINYNSSSEHDTGDWIELTNKGQSTIDLSNWELKDEDDNHSFIFPDGTLIGNQEFLIIAQDQSLFSSFYPSVSNIVGPMDFGLSGGGDQVRIYNNFGTLIDSLEYDDIEPWPNSPDGNGYTLELINLDLDNSVASSWSSSINLYGSPGIQNSSYLSLKTESNSLPNSYEIFTPYPNPFNGNINIPVMISASSNEELIILNLKGEIVKTIPLDNINPGLNTINWNGTNRKGVKVSTGIYFITLKNLNNNPFKKILYLK